MDPFHAKYFFSPNAMQALYSQVPKEPVQVIIDRYVRLLKMHTDEFENLHTRAYTGTHSKGLVCWEKGWPGARCPYKASASDVVFSWCPLCTHPSLPLLCLWCRVQRAPAATGGHRPVCMGRAVPEGPAAGSQPALLETPLECVTVVRAGSPLQTSGCLRIPFALPSFGYKVRMPDGNAEDQDCI